MALDAGDDLFHRWSQVAISSTLPKMWQDVARRKEPLYPPMKQKKRKLNPRQRRFVKAYTNPKKPTFGNGTKAAEAAGYMEKSAEHQAHRLTRNEQVSNEIQRVLDAAGATEEKACARLNEGLDAKTTRVGFVLGEAVYSKPLVDNQERRLTAVEILKLRGRYPTNRTVERLELLRIQNTLIVVPGGLPEPEEKAKQVRQLTD